jgi:hypothetical protein
MGKGRQIRGSKGGVTRFQAATVAFARRRDHR